MDQNYPDLETDPEKPPPNIVIIMASDLGFNDVSFHGSNQFYTPNIDSLGYQGLILNNYYSPSVCSGSTASFFTGKYPSRLGLQAAPLQNDESSGLGQMEKLMPEYFREGGYKTVLVGKWHLGFHQKVLTPLERGFDQHFGPWGARINYLDHSHRMPGGSKGLDMRNGTEVWKEARGTYATNLFSEKAIEIVKEHNFEDQPLFLVLSHIAPGTNGDGDLQARDANRRGFKPPPSRAEPFLRAAAAEKYNITNANLAAAADCFQFSSRRRRLGSIFQTAAADWFDYSSRRH
uniref:Sulfatase N-terminal domain-containing protein n=1 Tax=Phlebotomus papatasi TaxID=29031 RepID=A0A1B0CYF3_PHLPP